MDDIEDLFKSSNEFTIFTSTANLVNRKEVKFEKKLKKLKSSRDEFDSYENEENDSFIPGTQHIFIKTWGCSHNNSDSEYMAGQLSAYGFTITENRYEADLWLLNSCTVKNPAEDHLKNEIRSAKRCGKKIVVAGCVSQGAPKSDFLYGLSIIGVQQIDRVVEVVEETLKGNSVRLLSEKKSEGKKQGGASLLLPKIRKNPLIEIISISTGCLNQCTYCKTKHARGELGSFPIEEIVERAQQSFNEGVCEIWLTSEDTGAYGRDIGVTLPDLLRKLVTVIPIGCKLRLGMTNPPYILDHLEEMGEILKHPRVYSFLHVPVQSGSDGVLAEMKREYDSSDFCKVIDTLMDKVPGITIATDIICGFPTESEDDFNDTLRLCQKYKFPSLFINQFYPRPGTPAAKLPRISTKEVKRRTRILSEYFRSYFPYSNKMGKIYSVLVTEDSHDGKYWVGHNSFYEQILIPKDKNYLGKMVDVQIVETGKHFMKGKPLESLELVSPGIMPALPKGEVSGLTKTSCSSHDRSSVLLFIYIVLITLVLKFLWMCYM